MKLIPTIRTARDTTAREIPHKIHQNRKVIGALMRHVVAASPSESFADLKELGKCACAIHRLVYDSDTVGQALEQALARASR